MSDKVKGTVGQILLKKPFEKQFRSVSVTAHKWINVKKIKNISKNQFDISLRFIIISGQ